MARKTTKKAKAKPATRGKSKAKVSARGKAKKTERRGKKLPDLVGDRFVILSSGGGFLTKDLQFDDSISLEKIQFYKDKPSAKKHLNSLIDELQAQEEQEAPVGGFSMVISEGVLTAAIVSAKKVLATDYTLEIDDNGVPSIKHGLTFKTEAVSFKVAVKEMTNFLKEQANHKIQTFRSMQAEHRRIEKDFEKVEVSYFQKQLETFNKKISLYA